jgi:glycosyltransferase involved in cell wall biosynthesis
MTKLLIGIPVRERLDMLDATLASLRRELPGVPLVLLADGVEHATRQALGRYPQMTGARLLSWTPALGDAACFNRLARCDDAETIVLLENGARVAPGALQRLLQVLQSDTTHGLAGPSTNRAWNEQQCSPGTQGDDPALARVADQLATRHGDAVRSLAPLHSLGDFCFAVARRVVDRIGAADEDYGQGPCWEMDYSVRAVRAGFLALWVPAAYVWRAPVTEQRRRAEQRHFTDSKHRYQDRFCGLRLRGEASSYDAHCTGEACSHFAPRELIATRVEFRSPALAPIQAPASSKEAGCTAADLRLDRALTVAKGSPVPVRGRQAPLEIQTAPAAPVAPLAAPGPLVSCIMPTADRRPYVAEAVAAFLAQDYPRRELIVLDEGHDPVADLMPADARVRYQRIPRGQSLGRTRNQACALARGELIVHWDDDDWHAYWRLSFQVQALLEAGADLCGLERLWFYDPNGRRAWQYRHPGGSPPWVAGGSLCYRRSLWERVRFPDVSVGEDTRFVRAAAGARTLALPRDDFYVARVHAGNTSPKHTSAPHWHAVSAEPVEALIAQGRRPVDKAAPLVSCIMPTRNRAPFVALALRRFAEQQYVPRELIVVDDGTQPVEHQVAGQPGVHYRRLTTRCSIGAKRNLACDMARGEFIVQWDDDDWYGPQRLTRQLAPLCSGEADITGLHCRWLACLDDGAFWSVSAALHQRLFVLDVHGGTLAWHRRLWDEGVRYPDASLAEDAALLRAAVQRGARLQVLKDEGDFVYMRHGTNAWRFTAGQEADPLQWSRHERPAQLDAAVFASYREAWSRLRQPV